MSLKFKTLEAMDRYYYPGGRTQTRIIRKATAPTILSTEPGVWQAIYGKKVWSQLNQEANAVGVVGKEPWTQSGWRVVSARPGTPPDGGLGEAATLPALLKPTFVPVSTKPKTTWHGFGATEVEQFLSQIDDAIDLMPVLREEFGKYHTVSINYAFLDDVTDLAANRFESLDRVCSSYAEVTNCGDVNAGDSDIYGIDRDNAASWADAQVGHGSNTDRDLTTALIDALMALIWAAGGKPKVIITGYDTLMRWQQLLESERRYMEASRVMATFNGVKSVAPGVEAGFMVATYHGIPIIPSFAQVSDGISRIHFLDTDYVKFRVAKPTQYLEAKPDKFFETEYLGWYGGYRTMGELICKFFAAQGKLRDLQ